MRREYFPRCCRRHLGHESDYVSLTGVPEDGFAVRCHYTAEDTEVPKPFREFRGAAVRSMEATKQFNGNTFSLVGYSESQQRDRERPVLDLTFAKSDYLRFRMVSEHLLDAPAMGGGLTEGTLHDQVLGGCPADADSIAAGLAHSFAVNILVVSDDGYALFAQRRQGGRLDCGGAWGVSVNEGLRRSDDGAHLYDETSAADPTPSIEQLVIRGTREEIGVDVTKVVGQVRWTNFGINWAHYQPCLLGYMRLPQAASDLDLLIPLGRDYSLEVEEYEWVPFDAASIVGFVRRKQLEGTTGSLDHSSRHDPVLWWAIACSQYALVADLRSHGAFGSAQMVPLAFAAVLRCSHPDHAA